MKRAQSSLHLDFVRDLPCLICGDNTTVECCHIRYADRRAGKRETGMGEKSDDIWAVPLCGKHHREQHSMGERKFWALRGIDPVRAALALMRTRMLGDRALAERLIAAHGEEAP